MKFGIGVVAVVLAGLSGAPAIAESATPAGAWAERVQVIYQKDEGTVVRRAVRVWDSEPEKKLDFVWEPAEPDSLAADGSVTGKGKLVWRVRGSASYDPNTIYSTYVGEMKDGRPDGEGRLQFRSGELFEGHFAAGLLSGRGVHVDTAGNRYEGEFSEGRPDGEGRLAETNGSIYTGTFAHGVRHGEGETRLAGGATYISRWTMGLESGRPEIVADATLGGLMKAQSGGDAGRVEISVAIEPRMTQQAIENDVLAYQHLVREEDIAVYPVDEEMNNFWNGTGVIHESEWMFEDRDLDAPAYVEVEMGSTDGKRVDLDRLELQVANSEAYRKPMLSIVPHRGYNGFRPSFSIKNHGWGDVRDMTMNFQFTGQDEGSPASRSYSHAVGSFDQGTDVGIRNIFDEAGVDTRKLEQGRFSCQSIEAINVCRSQVFNEVGFGELADFVSGDQFLTTTAVGTFDYSWADDAGNVYPASEQFRAEFSLAVIETPNQAECGAGYNQAPEALRYQDVNFPVGKQNYTIELPVRGNRKLTRHVARLKLAAEPRMSSFHQFSVAATFADGSVRKSKPVSFFFMRPRDSNFQPGMEPPVCTLSDDAIPGC
ncbi:MAG: hypothetical protein KKB66_19820 [Alphaproteobacteria bacterium]|nr:hypothetical protein [Alphaproteobacteria bacterium]MBU0803856.1 hypothetical protein [Alphaproteobacteria bacterium]MBU0872847.1 hypothetical protein [Alphaproteobacteria bacterium]MBU1402783.1 hypothetical protein [Alphaproteobacteria bacterium]MBU1593425.1 hypothetical protein [Alphaproteobacteria bacterium]